MNGRFSRLEFRTTQPGAAVSSEQAQVGTPVRTADHHRTAADDAFRAGQFEMALKLYTRALHVDRGTLAAWVGQVQMLVELTEYPEARLWADKSLEVFRNNGDLLAAKARASAREGDRRIAMITSDAAVASPGASSRRWQSRGEVMLATNPTLARDCFERSLAEPLADWFDRVVIARAYLFFHRPAPAMEFARAAVDLIPSNGYAWFVLGLSQERLGWAGKAATSYERSTQLSGDHSDARRALDRIQAQSPIRRLGRRITGIFRR